MLADYHIIRRHKLKLNDLYTGDPDGIYWYWHGFNWRALIAFISGIWPLFREFIFLLFKQPRSSAPYRTRRGCDEV